MKILVIGGSLFFGKLLVEKLLAAGHSVTIFTRGNLYPKFTSKVEHIIGDRTNYSQFTNLLANRTFDVIVDNIAYEAADVKCVLDTFNGKIGQYILCSSGSVYKFIDNSNLPLFHAITETEASLLPVGDHPYSDGKRACELVLFQSSENKISIPFSIIRPTVVHGWEDPIHRSWFWVYRIQDKQPILLPYSLPSSIFNHVYADDVANAMFQTVGNTKAFNNAYNIAGSDIITLEEFLFLIARVLNLPLNLYLAAPKLVLEQSELAKYEPIFLGYRHVLDINKAICDLGFKPTPINQWLRTTVESLVKAPPVESLANYDTRQAEIYYARKFGLEVTPI